MLSPAVSSQLLGDRSSLVSVCFCFTSLCVVESVITKVTGVVGGQVTIQCSYADTWFVKSIDKYFCRKKCDSYNDILVQTQNNKNYIERGRYAIHDNRYGDFTVTIKNLMKTDSGTYWCGVERYGPDTYQEVHLTVTDAPPKPSTVTSRPHFSTNLPNLSATLSNISTTFLTSGEISVHSSSRADPTLDSPGAGQSQRAGLMVWTSVGLVVMVTVLGLVLLLFYRQRRGTRRTPPPVSSNTQPDPTGEVDCVYEEIREADRQTDTLPVVICVVYSTVKSPTYPAGQASTTYPAGQDPTTYPADQVSTTYPAGQASTTYPAGQVSTTYPADQVSTTYPAGQASTTYPAGQVSTTYPAGQVSTTYPADQVSTTYPAGQTSTTYPAGQASTTHPADQASTTYSACQPSTYPAGQTSTTYPAGHPTSVSHCDIYANASCHKDDINPSYSTADQPASLIYSSVDLPTDFRVSSRPPTASGSQDDSIYSTAQPPKDTVESTRYPAVDLSKDTPEDTIYSTAQLPKDTVESTRYPAVHLSKDTPEDAIYSTAQLPKDTVESTRYPAVDLSKDTPEDTIYSTAQLPKDTVESTRYPAVHLSKDTPEDAIYSTAQLPKDTVVVYNLYKRCIQNDILLSFLIWTLVKGSVL
ncbi:location of vulva defective 1-like [Salvelinus alpinus]|uniref:location of vulva defective 1-like n=1 Tax=Salvelinus alpinus TaxID=8036 RepID=UPI0039FCEB25